MNRWMVARCIAAGPFAVVLLPIWSIVVALDIACSVAFKGLGQFVTWGNL